MTARNSDVRGQQRLLSITNPRWFGSGILKALRNTAVIDTEKLTSDLGLMSSRLIELAR